MDRFNRAIKGNPDDAQAHFGLARIYAERNKPETAVELYAKALKLEKTPIKKAPLCRMRIRQAAPGTSSNALENALEVRSWFDNVLNVAQRLRLRR